MADNKYAALVERLRDGTGIPVLQALMTEAADAIEELQNKLSLSDETGKALLHTAHKLLDEVPRWVPATERLPECEWGAEVGNIEWISHGIVSAGCFGRGGKWRDAYFRTWTDATEGMDAKDAECWRIVQLPKPPKEINQEERDRELCRSNYAAQLDGLGYNADGTPKEVIK